MVFFPKLLVKIVPGVYFGILGQGLLILANIQARLKVLKVIKDM
jgi:hypothetical protein